MFQSMAGVTITLLTGQQMPVVGLGTWRSSPGQPRYTPGEHLLLDYQRGVICISKSITPSRIKLNIEGRPLDHNQDPSPALSSQPTFLPASLPTSHRWSLST